ncbi:MAG: hypothetical protein KDE20_21470 [Caldilineaceae bacterium]|nr:hypothetical protein [Caldilineaceae bacterium]
MMAQPNNTLNASFQQKSTAVSLVVILSAAAFTFFRLWQMAQSPEALQATSALPAGFWPLMIGMVILIVVMQIVLQTVLVIGQGSANPPTAHEKMAAQKASRNAYYVLATGVFGVFASLLFGPSPFVMGSLLLVALILAESVKFASQLVYAGAQ